MKKWIILLGLGSLTWSCAPVSSPQQGVSVTSAEVEARQRTDQMKSTLLLNPEQTDKIYLATVVHIRTVRKLRAANEVDKIPSTDQSYASEVQKILTAEQYARFKSQYGY